MRLIDADKIPWTDLNDDMPNTKIKVLITFAEKVNRMPTIEERKTGKWEERKVSSEKVIDEWQSARCSVCGKYHTTPYMYYFDSFSFCPNCGADMRGET